MFVLHSCYAAGTGHLLSRQLNRMHKWNKDQYMIFNSHYHIEIGATEAGQKHESHQTSNTIKCLKFEMLIYVPLLPKMAPGANVPINRLQEYRHDDY